MLVAFKNPPAAGQTSPDSEMQNFLLSKITPETGPDDPLLTDNHAPVDYLTAQLIE
jgi:hypothetical protein